ARSPSSAVAAHVELGERAAETRLRRLVDEALLAQRPHALLENRVADLDALARVDVPQATFELEVAVLGAELALDHPLAMAQRIDDVHREHQLVERRALPLGFAGRRRAHLACARVVIVLPRTLRRHRWRLANRCDNVVVKPAAARSRAPALR